MVGVVAGPDSWGNVATIVCDLDGVVYVGSDVVPGSAEALRLFRGQGKRLLFVTNNSTKTPAMVAARILALTGFDIDESDVVTSGLVTALTVEGDGVERVLVVGGPALVDAMAGRGIEVVSDWRRAEAVVSGMDLSLTYDHLAAATLAIRAGARLYATNTDATYPTPEGQKPGGGAILAALTTATGVEPTICGKPHAPMGKVVADVAGRGRVLVVGDRPETDVALGKRHGWATALVLTGVTTDPARVPPGLAPDVIVDSLADLPGLLV